MEIENSGNPINDLIEIASQIDVSAESRNAAKEMFQRSDECGTHINNIINLLHHPDASISNLAFLTLKTTGTNSVPFLIKELDNAKGHFRAHLLSLLSIVSEFKTYYPILKNEFNSHNKTMKFHAANCFGRTYDQVNQEDGNLFLTDCINLLKSCQNSDSELEFRTQAVITLRKLGVMQ